MFGARHLREDRLLDCYTAERSGEPIDPPAAEHLADCAACAGRYAEMARFMDDVRTEVDAELDEVFPAERLRLQQQHIAHRLEHVGHAARVISFPGQVNPLRSRASRIAPRWVMGAAAAGLIIGVSVGTFGVGTFVDSFGSRVRTGPSRMAIAQPAQAEPPAMMADPIVDAYDQFLLELELAGDRPYTAELVALDELTPHVQPISMNTGLR